MQGPARKDVVLGAARVYTVALPGPKWKSWIKGYTACGKTTIAREIRSTLVESDLPCTLLQTNQIRNQMADRRELVMAAEYFREDTHRDLVYGELIKGMSRALGTGKIAILDGTFNKEKWRVAAYEANAQLGSEVFVVSCQCAEERVVWERLRKRIYAFEDPHFVELDVEKGYSIEDLDSYVEESFQIYRAVRDLSEHVGEEECEKYGVKVARVDTLTGRVSLDFLGLSADGIADAVDSVIRARGCAFPA